MARSDDQYHEFEATSSFLRDVTERINSKSRPSTFTKAVPFRSIRQTKKKPSTIETLLTSIYFFLDFCFPRYFFVIGLRGEDQLGFPTTSVENFFNSILSDMMSLTNKSKHFTPIFNLLGECMMIDSSLF